MAPDRHTSIDSMHLAPTRPELLSSAAPALKWAVLIAVIAAAYVIVAAAMTAISAHFDPASSFEPLARTALALLMCGCSVSAIWWARSRWSSYWKTCFGAIAVMIIIWGVLVTVVPEASQSREAAASWVASFALQAVLTAVMASVLGLAYFDNRRRPPRRYSVAFLMTWTTVIACVLGGGRWLFAYIGWNTTNFFASGYFDQLQAAAIANAVVAVGILACARASWRRTIGITVCILTVPVLATLATVSMWVVFDDGFDPPAIRYFLLMITEGAFLVVTLLPLEIAHRPSESSA